ncbi:MAG: AAA family ATPase [Nitrososphaerota archaeon]|nr:AAA family ATPase [Nitrososphaerota archaeon]
MKRFFSIELENYRQYKGRQEILFGTSEEKNFTVIEGPNGAGKTNLANAITWCLYNKELRLSDSSRAYSPINGTALQELPNGKLLDMSVRIKIGTDKPQFIIQRFLRAYKGPDGDIIYTPTMKVLYLEDGRDWKEHPQPNFQIRNLLPEPISGFFLFDGERLDEFFKTENREGVRQALDDVTQVSLINKALDRLEKVRRDLREEARGLSSRADDILGQIEAFEKAQETAKSELGSLEKQRGVVTREIQEIDEKLKGVPRKEVQELAKERNELELAVASDVSGKKSAIRKFEDLVVEEGPRVYAADAILKTIEVIERKYKTGELPPKIREDYLQDLLKSGRCICGTDISKPGPHRANIEKHLRVALLSEVDEEVTTGRFEAGAALKMIRSFPKSADDLGINVRKITEELTRKEERLKEISAILGTKYDIEEISRLESDRTSLDRKREEFSEKIGSYKMQIDSIKSTISSKEAELNRERRKDERNSALQAQIDLCESGARVLAKVKGELMDEIRKTIEAKTKEYFLGLIWKKGTFVDVKIDKDYSVSVIHHGGWDAIGSLSAGERQLLALSFMSALQKVSGFDFPVIIDTPLGRISSEPKESIASLLPDFLKGTQVTMLVTDEEYTESVRSRMVRCVGKEWKLEYDDERDETKVVPYAT